MKIFSYLYDRVLGISKSKKAPFFLGCLSFFEAIFIPLPPDILLVAMTLADKAKVVKYVSIVLICSVLGGVTGYYLGMFSIDLLYTYIVSFGYESSYLTVQNWFVQWGFWVVFLAGFTPIPYKIFTVGAGAINMALFPFIVASVISRGLRFAMVGFSVYKLEEKFTKVAAKYMDLIGWSVLLLSIILYYLYVYFCG